MPVCGRFFFLREIHTDIRIDKNRQGGKRPAENGLIDGDDNRLVERGSAGDTRCFISVSKWLCSATNTTSSCLSVCLLGLHMEIAVG